MTQRLLKVEIQRDLGTSDESINSFVALCLSHNIEVKMVEIADLFFCDNFLHLKNEDKSFSLDWHSDLTRHLSNTYSLASEPLAKVLGIKKSKQQNIVDATLGTGKDAILLLSFGATVVAFERNLSAFCLSLDALRRGLMLMPQEFSRMRIHFGEAINSELILSSADAIYYDPMYPEKKKAALPRKEMQVFHEIIGADEDIEATLKKLIESRKKVILKRPLKASSILKPSSCVKGKTTRYDLYFKSI